MTPDNLATVICPNLLRAPNDNFGLIMKNMGPITVLFKALVTHVSFTTRPSIAETDALEKVHFIFGEEEVEEEDMEESPDDLVIYEEPEEEEEEFVAPLTSSPEPEELYQQDSTSSTSPTSHSQTSS